MGGDKILSNLAALSCWYSRILVFLSSQTAIWFLEEKNYNLNKV